jgi:hypothetical protein
MKYKAKSILIARKGKRDEEGGAPVYVEVFSVNDPHKTTDVFPDKTLDFPKIHKILITGLDVEYLIGGSDLVINDLTEVDVEVDKKMPGHLLVSGKQKK